MADSLWGLCADDPFAGEWNQSCTYWTVIYAGAPAALFLTCTLINVSTLLAFPARRTAGHSWRASAISYLSLAVASLPSVFVLVRFLHAPLFTAPLAFQQLTAIVNTLSWSLALVIQSSERRRRLPRLGWPLRLFFVASCATASLHAPPAVRSLLDASGTTRVPQRVQDGVFLAQFSVMVLLALTALLVPRRHFSRGRLAASRPIAASSSSALRHAGAGIDMTVSSPRIPSRVARSATLQSPLLGGVVSSSSVEEAEGVGHEDESISWFAAQRPATWIADAGAIDDDDLDEDDNADYFLGLPAASDLTQSQPVPAASTRLSNYGSFSTATATDSSAPHRGAHAQIDSTPEERASIFGRFAFGWIGPLLTRGERRSLQPTDIANISTEDRTEAVCTRFALVFARRQSEAAQLQETEGFPMVEEEVPPPSDDSDAEGDDSATIGTSSDSAGYASLPDTASDQAPASATPTVKLCPKHRASLFRALTEVFGPHFYFAAILKIISDAAVFAGPLALNLIIAFLSDDTQPLWHGFAYVGGMFLVAVIQSISLQHYFHQTLRVGMNVRAALTAALFSKSLRLSRLQRQSRNSGQVVNLMSTDVAHLQEMLPYSHMLWSAPLQIAVALWALWTQVGIALLSGLGVMLVLLPMNVYFTTKVSAVQTDLMARRDKRVKLSSEMVSHMQFVKMSAWERCFGQVISEAREFELAALWRYSLFQAGQDVFWNGLPVLVSLATFATFALLGRDELTPSRAFTALALFNILQFPMSVLPYVINDVVEAVVSLRRLSDFLLAPELQPESFSHLREPSCRAGQAAIHIEGATYSWSDAHSAADSALEDVNLSIPRGKHVAIVGRTGGGKSALLLGILGDLNKVCGTQAVRGSIAYCEQAAWIQNMTLRDNILFGRPYDVQRYQSVLSACALEADLAALPGGDQTEIGSNGINLSGGQRQRVSLARAVYSNADIFLLDDPFSALDAHVSQHVVAHCLQTLLKHKTVVLATHCHAVLPMMDSLIVVDKRDAGPCFIRDAGTLAQLRERGIDFENLLLSPKHDASVDETQSLPPSPPRLDSESSPLKAACGTSHSGLALPRATSASSLSTLAVADLPRVSSASASEAFQHSPQSSFTALARSQLPPTNTPSSNSAKVVSESARASIDAADSEFSAQHNIEFFDDAGANTDAVAAALVPKRTGQLTDAEERAHGAVEWSVYQAYIAGAGGWCFAALPFMLVLALVTAAGIGTDRWLAYWSTVEDSHAGHNTTALARSFLATPMHAPNHALSATAFWHTGMSAVAAIDLGDKQSTWFYLGIYSAFSLGGILLSLAGLLLLIFVSFRAARKFHDDVLFALMRAPMSFFDVTPIGRVLNRLSQDINVVDESLPENLYSYLQQLFVVAGVLLLICSISPLLIVAVLPVAWFYSAVQRLYLASSRDLKRLVSVGRSPIFSHFVESLRGAASIRAFAKTKPFTAQHIAMVDDNLKPYYASVAINRWLAIRLEFVGNLISAATALLAVSNRGSLGAALGALSISYTMRVTSTLNWMVRTASDLETNIVSLERLLQLISVPSEAPDIVRDRRPDASWPQHGAIEVKHLCIRYRPELPLVLRDVSFAIRAGEKVGVVGRTGSGKSSLMLALLRLVEACPVEPAAEPDRIGGAIFIDGVDVSRIGLADLRSRVAILPQDPVLFSGTLRFNLDPFQASSDEQIWAALERANLTAFVRALKGQLDFEVAEAGANVSHGQRQQIALARAILRRPRIFLMDEGTSAVDSETDAFIQRAIQECFADATVLIIAHRIDTVLGCDRIMVLDAGRVSEFDSPAALLARPHSAFAKLAAAARVERGSGSA